MRVVLGLLMTASCGGATPALTATATSASTPTSTSTPTPTPASTPPVPTGGSVLVGEIVGTKKFAPKPTIDAAVPALLDCYNKVRAATPALSGKLKLLIQVNEAGAVLRVESEGEGSANDPTLVACIGETLKNTKFPKPGGMATVVAPLLFRP